MYSSFISSYYIHFICFNVLIDLILMIRLRKTEGYGAQEKWISRLLAVGMVCSISDILCISLSPERSGMLFYLVNCLFYYAFVGSTLLILNYSLDMLNLHMKNVKAETVLEAVPMLLITVGMISSYWMHSVFYVGESGVYQRGSFYLLFYITCCLYVFALTIISMVAWIKRKTKGTGFVNPVVFASSILIGTALQVVFPSLPLSNMGLTLTFLLVFVNNQEKIINRNRDERDRILRETSEAQEAQIEEITALNAELEERQAQLEEAAAEQENQIQKITELNEKLQGQKEQMEEMNSLLEERYRIIRSSLNGYFAAYYIDLQSNLYEEIKSIASIREKYASKGNAQECLSDLCEKLIDPQFTEQMLQFVDLSTIKERMKGKELISSRYIGNTTGWSEAYFIVSGREPDGTPKSMIWCSRAINEEIEREQEYERNLIDAKEQAEAANNAKSTFLFNMSHDIRTPMNAILGFTQLIKKAGTLSEQQEDYLHKIETSGEYLLVVINNILDMARIESGKMELDESFVDLLNEDNKTEAMLTSEIMKKNLVYTSSIDIQHRYVYADTAKTKQVTMNILSNAIKYTPEGGKIDCNFREVSCDREGYARYVTTISDTGIGMSQEFIEHIFDSFTREKTVTENKVVGTGLGMSIVKKLVDLMGGSIEVQSELGKGSTFIITVDFRLVENPEIYLEKKVSKQPDQVSLAGKRILLAEDNDLNAEIAMEILKETGAEIERAEDGVICIDMLRKSEIGYYDLILMDIQMPNLDGYEATEKIRRAGFDIPIIAMTANAFEEDKREALRTGMNGHLAKPINVSELLNVLASLLG